MDTDANMIPVNNFFAHFVKEISITKCGSDKELIPTFSPYETYQYVASMLKHLPEKALKTHLYSEKLVYYTDASIDRIIHNGDGITAPTGSTADQIAPLKKN